MPHIPGHSPNYITAPSEPGFTTAVDAGNLIRQLSQLFQKNMNMPGNTPPMTRESQNNLLRDLFQRTMGALQAQGQAMSQSGQMMRDVTTPPYTLPMLNNIEQRSQAPVMNPQQFGNFAQRSTPPQQPPQAPQAPPQSYVPGM